MKPVFVDTSGFYALLDGSDPAHSDCLEAFRRARAEGRELVTTSTVLQETWALLQTRLGWDAVDAWLDRILVLCRIIWIDALSHSLGEARCRQARERRLSLTDCVTIEMMRRLRISEFIGNDDHLAREGFHRVQG